MYSMAMKSIPQRKLTSMIIMSGLKEDLLFTGYSPSVKLEVCISIKEVSAYDSATIKNSGCSSRQPEFFYRR